MLIQDSKGTQDVLKLVKVGEDRNYASYSASLDNKVTVSAGKAKLSILLIANNIVHSKSVEMYLNYSEFTMAKQIQFFENVSKDIVNKYYQMEEMTKMNIEIYQQIEEGLLK